MQAACLEPILARKVLQWAAAAGGFVATGNHCVENGIGDDDSGACRLKSVRRAVEKAVRSYGHDVSRLVSCLCELSTITLLTIWSR